MERIIHVCGVIPKELHSDFRWALELKGETAKDALADLIQEYVRLTKLQVANGAIQAR